MVMFHCAKFHTIVSNSEMASPKSIQSLYFFWFLKAFYMIVIWPQNLKIGKLANLNVIFLVMDSISD